MRSPENWAGLLNRHDAEIRAAAASTGLILREDGSRMGIGFIVAPGLLMTARFVLDEVIRERRSSDAESDARATADAPEARLCLGTRSDDCRTILTLGGVVYRSKGSCVALANLLGPESDVNPRLRLAATLPDTKTLVGRYAYVTGYPITDLRAPESFVRRLIPDAPGRERVMPGRILAIGTQALFDPVTAKVVRLPSFTTDLSTIAGTSGGPLIDLMTGDVLGVSYGSYWGGGRGKFAYAEVIPQAVHDLADRRLRGEPAKRQDAPPAK